MIILFFFFKYKNIDLQYSGNLNIEQNRFGNVFIICILDGVCVYVMMYFNDKINKIKFI